MQFASLQLSEPILRALVEQRYETPTPIQEKAIPPALEGRDVLGCAQTGTGKTAAFALPILDRLLNQPANKKHRGPAIARALVLAPTRELACQIADSFATYGRHTGLRQTVIYGGVKQIHQERSLRKGVDIIVATPGRLMDLCEQGIVDLSAVTCFVLDEADRMLDMGFIQPIREIASQLHRQRQTMLFSATLPREIKRLAGSLLHDPIHIAVSPVASTAPLIDQTLYMVSRPRKLSLLRYILENDNAERALVFTRTKHGAEKVCRQLNKLGIDSNSIHGNKTQNQRQRALDGFRRGYTKVLVATDVAARGLDVDNITHVFNFDVPLDPEAYVHRIGRTGRAGAAGIAISFCDPQERPLVRAIEKLIGTQLDTIKKLPTMEDVSPRLRTSDSGSRDEERSSNRESRDHHRSSSRSSSHSSQPSGRSPSQYSERDDRGASQGRRRRGDDTRYGFPNKKKSDKRRSNSDSPSRDFADSGSPRKKSSSTRGYATGSGNGYGGGGGNGGNKSGSNRRANAKAGRGPKSTGAALRTAKRKVHRKGNAKPGAGVRTRNSID